KGGRYKVKSLDELAKIRDEARKKMVIRDGESGKKTKVSVGVGSCGIAAGARETMGAGLQELEKRNLHNVLVTQTGCMGMCEQEPILEVEVPGQPRISYGKVTAEKARQIIARHVVNGNIIGEWVINR